MLRTLAWTRIDARSRRPGGLADFVENVLAWHDRARQRRVLAALDERMLRDIGLSRGEVETEVRKGFWAP
jgi:uncharacterized protein YjiS (DUF1127 family)